MTNEILNLVRLFRQTSNLPVANSYKEPQFYSHLIEEHIWMHEEWVELWDAKKNEDKVEIADAYCDLVYFCAGAILRFGINWFQTERYKIFDRSRSLINCQQILKMVNSMDHTEYYDLIALCIYAFENEMGDEVSFMDCFKEVHRSNMSKFCTSRKQAQDTILAYREKGEYTSYDKVGDVWVIRRQSDNKVRKSIDWVQPNLRKYIKDAGQPT